MEPLGINQDALLVVESLGKQRQGQPVFWDISFRVQRGEALALMGPSGAGKTTLLRCLNGLEKADAGRIVVGSDCLDCHDSESGRAGAVAGIRRRVGMVFQGFHLFSHRTVLENVIEAPIFVKREAPETATKRALQLLERVGVAHRIDAYPEALSGGEQQRVAIARALAMNPEVLLLDEPTSALDDDRIAALTELLRSFLDQGLALVAVTHDGRFAQSLAGTSVMRLPGPGDYRPKSL